MYIPRLLYFLVLGIFVKDVHAEDNYDINLSISGVKKGIGNLEIFFKFFSEQGLIEKQILLSIGDQDRHGKFQHKFEYGDSDIEKDFYLFGRLLSKDGSGKTIGFLPLKLVKVEGRNIDKDIFKKERKRIDLKNMRIIYFGEHALDLDGSSCWRNTITKKTGLAARESYPFVDFQGFTDDSTIIALTAVKDLIEYRFINSCPTWNRLRGILRDGMAQAWTSLNPRHLKKVLDYLQSLNNLATTDKNWREVHKIYNDVLISLLERVGKNRLPNNQLIEEIVFERHRGLIASHLNYIVWKLDDLINAYLRQQEYEKCLSLFSEIKNAIPSSERAQSFIKNKQAMRDKIILMFQTSTVCAAKMAGSIEMVEMVNNLSRQSVGNAYIHDYLTLFNNLDRLSGEQFPYRSPDIGNHSRIKEIKKYYEAFERNVRGINIPGGGNN